MNPTFRVATMPKLKCQLLKMTIVDFCYDVGGAYWGHGEPLYVASFNAFDEKTETEYTGRYIVRAKNRDEAKAKIRECFDFVTFYR